MNDSLLLLQNDKCLVMQPLVAEKFGRTNALVLQQIHYWLSAKESIGVSYEGKRWVYNSYKGWAKDIQNISESTVKRVVSFFKKLGILVTKSLHKNKAIRTNYYTIDYEKLKNTLGINHIEESSSFQNTVSQTVAHKVKMTSSSGQNDPMYIETKNTTKIILNTSEQVEQPLKEILNKKQKKQPTAKELLSIWNDEVGSITGQISALTKDRARFLISAFHSKFEASLEKWRTFCQGLTKSDFLMGRIKEAFKATLDWVLKFETLQKLFEGQYGVPVLGKENPCDSRLNNQDKPLDHPTLRKAIRERVGEGAYLSWFQNTSIQEQEGVITLSFPTKFQADYVERVFESQLDNLAKSLSCVLVFDVVLEN